MTAAEISEALSVPLIKRNDKMKSTDITSFMSALEESSCCHLG
jgi:hypothetical protein